MNQPEQPVQPEPRPPLVIYLTNSDSEDELEEPEAPPAPVILAQEDIVNIPPPNQEEFWDTVDQNLRQLQDSDSEEGEEDKPERRPCPQEQRTGQSPLSDDCYAAFESWNPYWIEAHYNPKRRRFWNPRNSSQSTAEE
jgi:hypothetical protein